MKIGDLVRTLRAPAVTWPGSRDGEVGIIVEDTYSFGEPSRAWKVCFGTITINIAWQELEVISERS